MGTGFWITQVVLVVVVVATAVYAERRNRRDQNEPGSESPIASQPDGVQNAARGSVLSDLLSFMIVASLLCAALSFFELP